MTMIRTLVALTAMLFFAVGAAVAAPLTNGDVLVADATAGQIRHFSPGGTDLGVFASGLNAPSWITGGPDGGVYVTEYGARRVVKLNEEGQIVVVIAPSFTPGGLVVVFGDLYVVEYGGGTLHRYAPTGANLGVFATFGGSGDFVTYDYSYQQFYISDWRHGVIHRVGRDGTPQGSFLAGSGPMGLLGGLLVGSYTGTGIRSYSVSQGIANAPPIAGSTGGSLYGLTSGTGGILAADYAGGVVRKFPLSGAPGVFADGLSNPRDLHVWRAPRGPANLDRLLVDLDAATIALANIRRATKSTRDAIANGEGALRACTGLRLYRQAVEAQKAKDLTIGPAEDLDSAGDNTAAALACAASFPGPW